MSVLFTVAAAITLLPALLGILGYRVLSHLQHRVLAAGEVESSAVAHRTSPASRWALLVRQSPVRFGGLALLVLVVLASPIAVMRV